ncbi:FIST signal transduction protein [Rhodovulum sp. P5]|uniref:FIST signal transduction protein n=1 Tax=Rhodovulum sp. P5 TaxID=1564506 RepID=UPI0009DA05D9|nr:FIST N-terminal domain-containing protein [Rhodovulum sp. P5]
MQISVLPFETQQDLDCHVASLMADEEDRTFCLLHLNATMDPSSALACASRRGTVLIGGSSCQGAITDGGMAGGAIFSIRDAKGSYGAALRSFGDTAETQPEQAARDATLAAIRDAARPGERPGLVWVYGTPGEEEAVLKGIESVVGSETPILGGSAADNSVAGEWFIFAEGKRTSRGVAVGVLYPSCEVSMAYQNGYAPTGNSGIVTRVAGRRVLEIDGRPAAEVYDDWTGGLISKAGDTSRPRSILSDSAFWPLGRETHRVADVPFYILAHPSVVDADGGLELFADVAEGERLTQMTGSVSGLTSRAARVADLAAKAGGLDPDSIAGALVVYCAGCMLSVRDRIGDVVGGVREAIPNVPFAGVFTFGEQGPILSSGNRHGNLMISCVVFSKEELGAW